MNAFISADIERCISDMESVVRIGRMSLEFQARAYDEDSLRAQSEDELAPLRKTMSDAEANAGKMRQLHECARQTYAIWTDAGFFARQKALRILR